MERTSHRALYVCDPTNGDLVLGRYLAAYLSSPPAQAWMKQRYFGMDMPRINVEDARAIPIALAPLDEQGGILRRVETLFKLTAAIEQRVAAATARADRLRQTILAKAFRGELVPTEAELARQEGRDYEPASALLERARKGLVTSQGKAVAGIKVQRHTTKRHRQ